jgi:hypothetical protein
MQGSEGVFGTVAQRGHILRQATQGAIHVAEGLVELGVHLQQGIILRFRRGVFHLQDHFEVSEWTGRRSKHSGSP